MKIASVPIQISAIYKWEVLCWWCCNFKLLWHQTNAELLKPGRFPGSIPVPPSVSLCMAQASYRVWEPIMKKKESDIVFSAILPETLQGAECINWCCKLFLPSWEAVFKVSFDRHSCVTLDWAAVKTVYSLKSSLGWLLAWIHVQDQALALKPHMSCAPGVLGWLLCCPDPHLASLVWVFHLTSDWPHPYRLVQQLVGCGWPWLLLLDLLCSSCLGEIILFVHLWEWAAVPRPHFCLHCHPLSSLLVLPHRAAPLLYLPDKTIRMFKSLMILEFAHVDHDFFFGISFSDT